MTLYYFEEMTMREIGLALGVVESRVSQVHASGGGAPARGRCATLRQRAARGMAGTKDCIPGQGNHGIRRVDRLDGKDRLSKTKSTLCLKPREARRRNARAPR